MVSIFPEAEGYFMGLCSIPQDTPVSRRNLLLLYLIRGRHDPTKRPSSKDALAHPAFWNYLQRISFSRFYEYFEIYFVVF